MSNADFALLENCLQDICTGREDLLKDCARDINYLRRRHLAEGPSFLTKALPRLGKAIIEGLENPPFQCPLGFKTHGSSALPCLFKGLLKSVFSCDGSLVADPDPYSVSELQQVTMLFYKLRLPYSEAENDRVVSEFLQTEEELSSFSLPTDEKNVELLAMARDLVCKVLKNFDYKNIIPSHGPGNVSTGEKNNAKYSFKRKYQRLHEKYPYYEYFSPSLSGISFESGWYSCLQRELNAHAKVVLVPKDSRGPRLISMEPLEIQWIQQGLLKALVHRIEAHPLTKGKVNFSDQSINARLALSSSLDQSLSTIDLKEASDRVSVKLFESLFPKEAVDHFMAARSTATVLPDGRLIPLHKFAPMGSALCFPVLALTIWSLARASISLSKPGRSSDRSELSVYVYGDDVIIPVDHTETVFEALESFGLRINRNKSFCRGFFRESCGTDAFRGVVTTPLRLRQSLEGAGNLGPELYKHLLSLSESFFDKGYWGTCRFLRGLLRRRFGAMHWTTLGSDGYSSSEYSVCLDRNKSSHRSRWNPDLQRWEFRVRGVRPVYATDEISGVSRMLKGLANPMGTWSDPNRVALRRRSVLTYVWSPV